MTAASRLTSAALAVLGGTERVVASAIVAGRATVDELVAVTDLPVAAVLATLALLERRGLVAGRHGRYRPAGALLGEPVRDHPSLTHERPKGDGGTAAVFARGRRSMLP